MNPVKWGIKFGKVVTKELDPTIARQKPAANSYVQSIPIDRIYKYRTVCCCCFVFGSFVDSFVHLIVKFVVVCL